MQDNKAENPDVSSLGVRGGSSFFKVFPANVFRSALFLCNYRCSARIKPDPLRRVL